MFSLSFVVWLEEVDFDERRTKGWSFFRTHSRIRKASIVDWVVVVVVVVSLAFLSG